MTFRLNPQDLPPLPPLVPGGDATRPAPYKAFGTKILRLIAVMLAITSLIVMKLDDHPSLPFMCGVTVTLIILVTVAGGRYQRFLKQELEKHPVGTVTATVSSRGLMGRNDLGRHGFVTFAIPQNCTSFTFLVTAKVYRQLKKNDRVTLTYQGWEILSFTPAPASET